MSAFRLLGDTELEAAIARLERTAAALAEAATPLGVGIREHYAALLEEARAERQRREKGVA